MSEIGRWRYRHTVLLLCVLAYFGVRFIEFALALVFPDIQTALGTSVFTIGVAVTASTITYALSQLPSGALGDRFGERRVIIAALGLTGVASLVLLVAPVGGAIVAGMSIIGAVTGTYYSPATALLSDLFEHTGRAVGIHRVGAQVVGLTGPVVTFLSVTYGWHTVPLISAALVVPLTAGFVLFVRTRTPNRPDRSIHEQLQPSRLLSLLSRPSVAFTTAIASVGQFVDVATFSFLPYILRAYVGFSSSAAGMLFTLYFIIVAVVQPVAGWLSDRFGHDPVTVGVLLIGILGPAGLLTGATTPAIAGAVVCLGVGMGWSSPVQSRAIDQLSDDERGTGFGLIRTVYIGFASLSGVVVGSAVTLGGWASAIGILAIAFFVPAVALSVNATFRLGL
ncbi:MFS transporter [Halocatena pleomorpha]|uniref:MFS transporter n=1 Tax=Halocatena pleomorpha TaxID=1785090 RepID=A0A3P3RLC8_9EURY|nr:MFS transporter [Halocatena pleomorpha]RRJ33670.1 MFS transporter [Halocatena pleomorpha]